MPAKAVLTVEIRFAPLLPRWTDAKKTEVKINRRPSEFGTRQSLQQITAKHHFFVDCAEDENRERRAEREQNRRRSELSVKLEVQSAEQIREQSGECQRNRADHQTET